MREIDAFEIERAHQEEEIALLICPILSKTCLGDKCMWWVRDWSEDKQRFQYNCAVSLIAIGVNDESLLRIKKESR